MSKDLITEARELCEKATPGPWVSENMKLSRAIIGGTLELLNWASDKPFYTKQDFDFIARSRTIIPELCDALEKAERESGCEWCKTPSHNPDIGGCTLVFYRSKAHPIGAYAISASVFDEYGEEQEPVLVRIDNCIHCGKRLEVKP